ncbi:Rha family transcriptional regulator, partial [Candidatus Ozemobacteraceae bacterium]|nr:Rha family transcriptional regulator [Candidatus Ozemobacteraceae bacterium]
MTPSKELVRIDGREPVASSEVLAVGFGVTHQAVLKLIEKYRDRFEAIRPIGFEIRSRLKGKHGGKDFRYCNLNEEQTTFLGSLLRNTDRVVDFKARLTREFFRMRSALSVLSAQKQNAEYLERRTAGKLTRRTETDTIKRFVEYAKNQGSQHAERYYANISKMKNQALFFLGEKFDNIREMLTTHQLS